MIGKLTGKIETLNDEQILIDVNGVGYLVWCPSSLAMKLQGTNSLVTLIIDTYVREDQITLFGFANQEEKDFFQSLRKISGIGAKTSLAVLSTYNVSQIRDFLLEKNINALKRVPGIGPKAATRIINELKTSSNMIYNNKNTSHITKDHINNKVSAAISALTNLQFDPLQASTVVKKLIEEDPNQQEESLIKNSLSRLNKKN